MDKLQEIKDRLSKITSTPWKGLWRGNTVQSHYVWSRTENKNVCSGISLKTGNADFIANAPTDIKYLLDALEQAQDKIETLTYNYKAAEADLKQEKTLSLHYKDLAKVNVDAFFFTKNREMVLRKALEELTEIVQGVIDGDDYKFDSLTLQPARKALQEGNQ